MADEARPAGISDAGWDWLQAALDPFRDRALRVTGLPDSVSAPTTVYRFAKTTTVAPLPGANWCCHAFYLPEAMAATAYNNIQRVAGKFTQNYYNGAAWVPFVASTTALQAPVADAIKKFGTFNILTWATDVSGTTGVFPGAVGYVDPATSTVFDCMPTNVAPNSSNPAFASQMRVIAAGFECENVTQALKLQGTVTCYRVANTNQLQSIPVLSTAVGTLVSAAGAANAFCPPLMPASVVVSPGPPATIAEAMLLEGTTQFEAKEGCYVICTRNAKACPLQSAQPTYRAFINSAITDVAFGGLVTGVATPNQLYNSAGPSQIQPVAAPFSLPTSCDISGAIFSGLSNETALTFNCVAIVEVAPHPNDPGFGVLATTAKPSPEEDMMALELYQKAVKCFPAGVPRSMNPLGEWFATAMNLVKSVAPTVLQMLPGIGPLIQPIAQRLLGSAPASAGGQLVVTRPRRARVSSLASSRASSVQSRASSVKVPKPKSAMKKPKKPKAKAKGG